jgi:hypothetical protein
VAEGHGHPLVIIKKTKNFYKSQEGDAFVLFTQRTQWIHNGDGQNTNAKAHPKIKNSKTLNVG